jgi:fibronectin type 3 domain-containing protein
MRNLFQILAILAMLAVLSGCGKSDSTSSGSTSSQTISINEGIDLNWIPPTTRADGSYLAANELAGYRIYMGTSRSNLAPLVDLINDNSNQHKVEDLQKGDYYFAITAYDNNGAESAMSQVLLITLT